MHITAFTPEGSSPRMRGALFHSLFFPSSVRIIPADAGSTIHTSPGRYAFEDHPRGCGEHRS